MGKDGAVMGVTVTRMSMNLHTQVLSQACSYTEGEYLLCEPSGLFNCIYTCICHKSLLKFSSVSLAVDQD